MNADQDQDKSIIVLVLGILGLMGCCICSPIAWWLGANEMAAIKSGQVSEQNRGITKLGMILGIIGSVLIIISVVFYLIMLTFFGGLFVATQS